MLNAHNNLTQETANKIGLSILNGEYPTDKKFISAAEISTSYNISMTTVREAVRLLYAKGLVLISKRTGITASPPERWNLFDSDVLGWAFKSQYAREVLKELNQLMIAIEPESARIAAMNFHNTDSTRAIKNAVERIKFFDKGSNSLLQAEIDFHSAILHASENPYFISMNSSLKLFTTMRFSLQNQSTDLISDHYEEYKKIEEAITSGNQDKAYASTKHLVKNISTVSDQLVSQKNTLQW